MIEFREGNIFEQPDITVVMHQGNTWGTLKRRCSAGIASQVEKLFPRAADADLPPYDNSKIGTYSWGSDDNGRTCFNLYTQIGQDTSYDALFKVLSELEEKMSTSTKGNTCVVGIPYGMGAGLANGRWPIVEAIIQSVFGASPIKCVICKLPTNK